MELVAVGDLHIEKHKFLPSYFDKIQVALNPLVKAVDYCKSNMISHLIILGDVFDTPFPKNKNQKRFMDILIKNSWLNFYIISGNHDYVKLKDKQKNNETDVIESSLEMIKWISDLKFLPNVHVYDRPTAQRIEKINFSFLPYPFDQPLTDNSLNIAHISAKGARADNNRIINKGHNVSDDGFWIIGHIHLYQYFNNVLYPGTGIQHSFGEKLPKGFVHLKVRNKKSLKVDWTYIETDPDFKLYNIIVESSKDLEQIKDDKSCLYRILKNSRYKLSDTFLIDHPNVIKNEPVKNLEKAEVKHKDNDNIELEPNYKLVEFLRSKDISYEDSLKAKLELENNILPNIKLN